MSQEQGYLPLAESEWTPEGVTPGGSVKLQEVPFTVRLFKLVAPAGAMDWVSTTDRAEPLTAQGAEESRDGRGQGEELPRGRKHLPGSETCQCRMARAHRHPLACGYPAWVSLQVKATELGQTLSELRSSVFRAYLRAELRHPRIAAC